MSDFTSKIISWECAYSQNIKWGSNTAFQDIFGFIIGYAQEKGDLQILDLGCGNGSQWEWYTLDKQKFNFSLEITGFEPFKNNASNFNNKINNGIDLINSLESCNKKFDIVVCLSVLEHVYDRKKFLSDCYKFIKEDGYSLINFDNGHFFNPKEWKRNIFGRLLAKYTFIKRYYQDFVDVEQIIKISNEIGMEVDDQVDYHLFINKQRLKLLNYCDSYTKGKLLDKIQNFEKDVSNIMDVKNNNLLKNKYTYSSTLILKKKTNKKSF